MVSDQGLSYALGNLLAGPGQWKNMYRTGAAVATLVNVLLAYVQLLPPLYARPDSELTLPVGMVLLEVVNAFIPLVALAFERPLKFILTLVVYVLVGLTVWTLKYEAATGGFA